ncbi:acylneuraminate cytidylyltransferase family protein [Aliarcobacter cryaerophilus]|uniref:acylneuraminate cytidylyltransferase family protein n=1 Tax=Aliarcobacter cryaerophilus TaxID=28198 RepID=UPI003DA357A5
MFNNKKVIAVIPARAGSKGLPNKNIKYLGGKPLVAWPIDIAKQSIYIDEIIVSTDGEAIYKIAKQYGAEVIIRPPELSTDESLAIDAIRHVIETYKKNKKSADIIVILEPTCPLRSVQDVDGAIELLSEFDSVATYVEASLNPHRAWKIENSKATLFIENVVPWLPRQKLPKAYQLNGAVYTFYVEKLPNDSISPVFGRNGSIIMPRERSLDIDTEIDFLFLEHFIKDKK